VRVPIYRHLVESASKLSSCVLHIAAISNAILDLSHFRTLFPNGDNTFELLAQLTSPRRGA